MFRISVYAISCIIVSVVFVMAAEGINEDDGLTLGLIFASFVVGLLAIKEDFDKRGTKDD